MIDLSLLNTALWVCRNPHCAHGCRGRVVRRMVDRDRTVPDLTPPIRRYPVRAPLRSYTVENRGLWRRLDEVLSVLYAHLRRPH